MVLHNHHHHQRHPLRPNGPVSCVHSTQTDLEMRSKVTWEEKVEKQTSILVHTSPKIRVSRTTRIQRKSFGLTFQQSLVIGKTLTAWKRKAIAHSGAKNRR